MDRLATIRSVPVPTLATTVNEKLYLNFTERTTTTTTTTTMKPMKPMKTQPHGHGDAADVVVWQTYSVGRWQWRRPIALQLLEEATMVQEDAESPLVAGLPMAQAEKQFRTHKCSRTAGARFKSSARRRTKIITIIIIIIATTATATLTLEVTAKLFGRQS